MKSTDYSKKIMMHLAKMLSVCSISSIHRTDAGVVKSVMNDDKSITDIPVVSDELQKKRKPAAKRTSWETTDKKESMLFDDQSLTLCIRLTSDIDHLDDLYYATIRPTLESLSGTGMISFDNGPESQISVRDKEIIASICRMSCLSYIDTINSIKSEVDEYKELVRHHEKTISTLKKNMEIPINKTRKVVGDKLAQLNKVFGRNFTLSKDAEMLVESYSGNDIQPLLDALEKAARLKTEIYDVTQITIDDTDIRIVNKTEKSVLQQSDTETGTVYDKRHAKIVSYLEKLEAAFVSTIESGLKPTAMNIANAMQVSSASITMWFDNHSEDAKRLCESNPNLCPNSRLYFEPLKNALAGKRNKANRA